MNDDRNQAGEIRGFLSVLPSLLDHIQLLKEILLEEQTLLLEGDPVALEPVLAQKINASNVFQTLLLDSGFSGSTPAYSEEAFETDHETLSMLRSFRAELLHLSEIASVNLVIAQESVQTVSLFLRALRQEEGSFDTYGVRGNLGSTSSQPAMVSTRG
ncbi:MAG: hypothetical protein ACYC9S_07840 [Leptospirales bacterium]